MYNQNRASNYCFSAAFFLRKNHSNTFQITTVPPRFKFPTFRGRWCCVGKRFAIIRNIPQNSKGKDGRSSQKFEIIVGPLDLYFHDDVDCMTCLGCHHHYPGPGQTKKRVAFEFCRRSFFSAICSLSSNMRLWMAAPWHGAGLEE